MWPPFFFGAIPTYGVLPYAMICEHSLTLSHNHIHMHTTGFQVSPYQSGFRSNHSTEDVLVKTTDDCRRAVDKGRVVGVIFLDFKKAFDSVPHTLLLKKIGSIGIRKNPLKWFRNFLSGHKQRVLIDGTSSDWLSIKCGIPQGSLLGPILFSLYVNDLPSVLVNMYADDTAIYTDGTNQEDVAKCLSDELVCVSILPIVMSSSSSETSKSYPCS